MYYIYCSYKNYRVSFIFYLPEGSLGSSNTWSWALSLPGFECLWVGFPLESEHFYAPISLNFLERMVLVPCRFPVVLLLAFPHAIIPRFCLDLILTGSYIVIFVLNYPLEQISWLAQSITGILQYAKPLHLYSDLLVCLSRSTDTVLVDICINDMKFCFHCSFCILKKLQWTECSLWFSERTLLFNFNKWSPF